MSRLTVRMAFLDRQYSPPAEGRVVLAGSVASPRARVRWEVAMREDVFQSGSTKDRATQTDLSAEIIRSIAKEQNQRITCMRVCGNNYRCNWWSPAPTKAYDNPAMRGLLVTTHVVAKSRFLNVVKVDNRLVVTDASADVAGARQ